MVLAESFRNAEAWSSGQLQHSASVDPLPAPIKSESPTKHSPDPLPGRAGAKKVDTLDKTASLPNFPRELSNSSSRVSVISQRVSPHKFPYERVGKSFTQHFQSGDAKRYCFKAKNPHRDCSIITRNVQVHPTEHTGLSDWTRVINLSVETGLDRHLIMREFNLFKTTAGEDETLQASEAVKLLRKSGVTDPALYQQLVDIFGGEDKLDQANLGFEGYVRAVREVEQQLRLQGTEEVFRYFMLDHRGYTTRFTVLQELKDIAMVEEYEELAKEVNFLFASVELGTDIIPFSTFCKRAEGMRFYQRFQTQRFADNQLEDDKYRRRQSYWPGHSEKEPLKKRLWVPPWEAKAAAAPVRVLGLKEINSAKFQTLALYVSALIRFTSRLKWRAKWQAVGREVREALRKERATIAENIQRISREMVLYRKSRKSTAYHEQRMKAHQKTQQLLGVSEESVMSQDELENEREQALFMESLANIKKKEALDGDSVQKHYVKGRHNQRKSKFGRLGQARFLAVMDYEDNNNVTARAAEITYSRD